MRTFTHQHPIRKHGALPALPTKLPDIVLIKYIGNFTIQTENLVEEQPVLLDSYFRHATQSVANYLRK